MIGEESWSVRTKELLAEEIKAIEEERVTIARSKTLGFANIFKQERIIL